LALVSNLKNTSGSNRRFLEHVVGASHILDDVKIFESSDVYWCFPKKREVSSINNEKIKRTFIVFYALKCFKKPKNALVWNKSLKFM
jgi:hypothetical protein